MSQSPSLRGSGRFIYLAARSKSKTSRLNPLHCGAVVASPLYGKRQDLWYLVSIPFIAGQWSLHDSSGCTLGREPLSQSPSLRGSGRFRPPMRRRATSFASLNPLHCGAVVASRSVAPARGRSGRVSQSPSLRGSGRFGRLPRHDVAGGPRLNPLHCGAVVASPPARGGGNVGPPVSIPFIAGQWSLRGRLPVEPHDEPGLNPLHCGAVVASSGSGGVDPAPRPVSIPFIAGQWSLLSKSWKRPPTRWLSQSPSLRGSGRFAQARARAEVDSASLNPLHCGAVVASWRLPGTGAQKVSRVSIPFIAGQWSLRGGARKGGSPRTPSQSPSLRGSGRFKFLGRRQRYGSTSQSPSLRGSGRFGRRRGRRGPVRRVSIPFIAGQWSLQKWS